MMHTFTDRKRSQYEDGQVYQHQGEGKKLIKKKKHNIYIYIYIYTEEGYDNNYGNLS